MNKRDPSKYEILAKFSFKMFKMKQKIEMKRQLVKEMFCQFEVQQVDNVKARNR